MKTFEVKSKATGKRRNKVVLHGSKPPAPSVWHGTCPPVERQAPRQVRGAPRMRAMVRRGGRRAGGRPVLTRRAERRLCHRAVLGHHAPNKKYDDRTDNCADQSGTLAGLIKAQRLAKIAGDKGPDDPENRGHDKTGGLVLAGHEELGNHSRHEADDDGPKNAHARVLPSIPWNEVFQDLTLRPRMGTV